MMKAQSQVQATTVSPLLQDIDVISFDAGFTLIYPEPSVGEVYAHFAAQKGYHLDITILQQQFMIAWQHYGHRNRVNQADNAFADETRAYRFWQDVFFKTLENMVPPKDLPSLFETCYHEYAKGCYWQLYPEVRETLTALRRHGFRLVVLSNWDRRLVQTLKETGLTSSSSKVWTSSLPDGANRDFSPKHTTRANQDSSSNGNTVSFAGGESNRFFEKVYISTLVGYAKPDPQAFLHIAIDLGVMKEKILHIGDTLEDDVFGAESAGIRSVWLQRPGEKKNLPNALPSHIPVISSLAELLPL